MSTADASGRYLAGPDPQAPARSWPDKSCATSATASKRPRPDQTKEKDIAARPAATSTPEPHKSVQRWTASATAIAAALAREEATADSISRRAAAWPVSAPEPRIQG